jgi:hypothetical protein
MNSKIFGIIALVTAIVSIFIPIVGIYLPLVAGLVAIFSAGEGFVLGASSIGINLINTLFMSPMLWVAAGLEQVGQQVMKNAGAAVESENSVTGLGMFLLLFQIGAGVVLFLKNRKIKSVVAQPVVA